MEVPSPNTLALSSVDSEILIGEEYTLDALVGSLPSTVKRTTSADELALNFNETELVKAPPGKENFGTASLATEFSCASAPKEGRHTNCAIRSKQASGGAERVGFGTLSETLNKKLTNSKKFPTKERHTRVWEQAVASLDISW